MAVSHCHAEMPNGPNSAHTPLAAGLNYTSPSQRTSKKLPVPLKESHQQDQQTEHRQTVPAISAIDIRLGAILQLCKVHLRLRGCEKSSHVYIL